MRNLLLVFLLLCLYAATSLATEVWFQPLSEDEQVLFVMLNAKRLETGLAALQLDGLLIDQARQGQGGIYTAASLNEAAVGVGKTVLDPSVSRLGLAVNRTQSQVTVTVATK